MTNSVSGAPFVDETGLAFVNSLVLFATREHGTHSGRLIIAGPDEEQFVQSGCFVLPDRSRAKHLTRWRRRDGLDIIDGARPGVTSITASAP